MTILILGVCSIFTSIISAVCGMGGGIVLLSIMTFFLPVSTIVPIHGAVQFVSNSYRTFLLRRFVHKKIFLWFCLGLPVGTILAIKVIKSIPTEYALFGIVAVIWYSLFKPKKMPQLKIPHWGFIFVGLLVGVLGPLVGATGPCIAPFFIRDDLQKESVVATKSSVQFMGHLFKFPTFFYLGFKYHENIDLILILTIAALLGTFIGVRLLGKVSENLFRQIYRLALFAASLRLIVKIWS
jgi:uncharacterized membrane protein YfcA